mgnify:CR=1 FL=1
MSMERKSSYTLHRHLITYPLGVSNYIAFHHRQLEEIQIQIRVLGMASGEGL